VILHQDLTLDEGLTRQVGNGLSGAIVGGADEPDQGQTEENDPKGRAGRAHGGKH
jgi:hypothetical protein